MAEEKNLQVEANRQEHTFTIRDQETGKVHEITVLAHYNILELRIKGYGDYESSPGFGAQALLDSFNGRLRLFAYADINNQEPTHDIDLAGALESNRKPEEST